MIWRFAILCLLSACCLQAADPSILLARARTDPSRMMAPRMGVTDWPFCCGYMLGGETAFTAVCWIRSRRHLSGMVVVPSGMWSIDAARATREGGDELPDILPMTSASGSRAWTFSDPHYDDHGLGVYPSGATWQYGCYAVNVETPTPLTITLAGCERQVAASNGVVQAFNMQGEAADYTLTVSPSDSSATYRIGFAVNPLVRFYGYPAQPTMQGVFGDAIPGVPLVGGGISNEWAMVAIEARLRDGKAIERLCYFTWGVEIFPIGEHTNTATRATFARNARISIYTAHFGGVEEARDVWGFKIFPQWLDDDQLRNVRDLDMFEMQRRGMTRWVED